MTALKIEYSKILKIGQEPFYSSQVNKRIKLLNIYILVTIHFGLLMPVGDYFTGILNQPTLICYAFLIVIMLGILALNYFHKTGLAAVIWLITVLCVVFVFSVFLLAGSYNEYYYVFIPGISLTLFDKQRMSIGVSVLSLFLFFIPYYIVVVYPESVVSKLDVFAVLGLFTCVYLLVNYFKKINNENEKKLNEFYEQLAETKRNELANLRLKFLKGKMNPHFMFNTMNSVQNLVIKGRSVDTYNYLSKFSSLIREHLNNTEKQCIAFGEEVSMLTKYLELEKLRFSKGGNYILDSASVPEFITIPSMVIQPFVENSLYRMFHKVDVSNRISIQFYYNDLLKCIIVDNGLSFDEAEEVSEKNNLQETSYITENRKNINEHLELLKELYGIKIEFEYHHSEENTKCVINIPYKEKK